VAAAPPPPPDALRATSRFTSPGQRDRIAQEIAADLHLPYQEVRSRIEAVYANRFHVSLEPGIFLVMAGGLIAAIGGALSVAWATRTPGPPASAESVGPGDRFKS